MVHALERVRGSLTTDGAVVLIQPHQSKRPSIAITSGRKREPVTTLISPMFQPLINAAMDAITTVTADGRFSLVAENHPLFRVRLSSLTALHRYLHLGQRPPRFPAGGRRRLHELWRQRSPGAQIEVSEHMTVVIMRLGRTASSSTARSAARGAETPRAPVDTWKIFSRSMHLA